MRRRRGGYNDVNWQDAGSSSDDDDDDECELKVKIL
jgi:hypothetical protein